MHLRVALLQCRVRVAAQRFAHGDRVAFVAFGNLERDVGAVVERRERPVLRVGETHLRDIAEADVLAADLEHRLLVITRRRLAVDGAEVDKTARLLDIADGVDIRQSRYRLHDGVAIDSQRAQGFGIEADRHLLVGIAEDAHLADISKVREAVFHLAGDLDEPPFVQRVARKRQPYQRTVVQQQLRYRFGHVRREVLAAFGDGVFGFVQRIDLVRAVLQRDDDGEAARLDDGLDLIDAGDAAEVVLDIAHGHLVEIVRACPRVAAADTDLVEGNDGKHLFGNIDVGIDAHEEYEQQQDIIEPLVAEEIVDNFQHG